MSYALDRISLTVTVDEDSFPFDYRYLWGPAPFGKPALRKYMHEVLHFWQALSMGFITNLAFGEWGTLLDYERTGDPTGRVALMRRFNEQNPEVGFSPRQLDEALCRYWDIHILNPVRILEQEHLADDARIREFRSRFGDLLERQDDSGGEATLDLPAWMTEGLDPARVQELARPKAYTGEAFDLLMQLEDDYASPYRLMLKHVGSKSSVILFPLVAYFSLQTRDPVRVFVDATNQLAVTLNLNTERERSIHRLWRHVFPVVAQACTQSSTHLGIGPPTHGWVVMNRMAKEGHPIYGHYFQLLTLAREFWGSLDFNFALPGDPQCRMSLAGFFLPPVTLFRDGRWIGESSFAKLALVYRNAGPELAEMRQLPDPLTGSLDSFATLGRKSFDLVLDGAALADRAQELYRRAQQMRQAALRTRYSSQA